MKGLEMLEKIDHTICLNSLSKHIEWNVDKEENIDCKSIEEFIECYDIIKKELEEKEELKKVLEILKSKVKFEVNDKNLFGFKQTNLVVNKDIFGSVSLTPEEYDLLKGWLTDEK